MTDIFQLKSTLNTYITWLRNQALPLWSNKGIDQDGASVEQILANGKPDLQANKRLRVQARQIFVFATAQDKGWIQNGEKLVENLQCFMTQHGWIEEDQRLAHLLDQSNNVIDNKLDLYDSAFFLLAYSWRFQVFKDNNALDSADKLLERLDFELHAPQGGWIEGNYSAPYRRQNPHMHLFEAFLSLYHATKQGKWLAKAGEIYALFQTHFYDHEHGVLLEYFNDTLQAAQGEAGKIIEPGHMMEWVWLLRQYQAVTNAPVDKYCHRLYHNAVKYGLDHKSGLLFDELDVTGKIIKASKRCWPMTEWIKASLVQAKLCNSDYDYIGDAKNAVENLMSHYLSSSKPGQYIDQLDENNNVCADKAPASSLYHLMAAGLEADKFIQAV